MLQRKVGIYCILELQLIDSIPLDNIVKTVHRFADNSADSNFHIRERSFVCDVANCRQKFVSAAAVARHAGRAHQIDGSIGKVKLLTSDKFSM